MELADQAGQNSAVSTIFNDFIGTDKKYKTAEEALASVPHAQNHISKLEADNKVLRDQQAAIQARLDALLVRGVPQAPDMPAAQQPAYTGQNVDVQALIEQALAKKQAESRAQENSGKVAAELKQLYADKAEVVYVEKARELGMSVDDLNSLSVKSPQAVLSLFKQNAQASHASIQSSLTTQHLGGSESVEALMSVLNTDPKVYYSPAHQEKVYKAYQKMLNRGL